ncbi:CsbD family protein [Streptomyces violascens]
MTGIICTRGDATSPQGKGVKLIAHVCNDLGGWGKGFVVSISRRWPEPEASYRRWHRERSGNDFGMGAVQFVGVAPSTPSPPRPCGPRRDSTSFYVVRLFKIRWNGDAYLCRITRSTACGGISMSRDEKAKAKAEQAKGKAKEALGRMVGNERRTAEGRIDQAKGDARQAKEKAKDAMKD